MAWLQVAIIVGLVGVIVMAMRRLRVSSNLDSDIDVDPVSDSWLAEHCGSRNHSAGPGSQTRVTGASSSSLISPTPA
jgi:hypothetical protein